MADRMTKEQRHRCMSRIKGKDTKPEMLVRRYLHSRGYRYRVNVRRLPGTPDIVLRKYRTVIFINGCFWHGHEGCRYYVPPKSNSQFWQQKIERNKQRDMEKRIQLRLLGWHTIIIWGCELMPKNRHTTLQALEQTLNKIYLLNNSVEVTAGYPVVEDTIGMVAEEKAPHSLHCREKFKEFYKAEKLFTKTYASKMKENRFKDLYIIGNGFDLHHGVKSSYNHFKKWLEKNDQDLLLEMEVLWNNNFQLWSDFERALGDIDYKYVKEKFGKYLHKEHDEIKQKFQGNHPELLPSCIGNHCLEAKLRPIVKKIAHAFNRWVLTLNQDISTLNPNIDLKENAFFINFNYTETLEILYGIHTNSILHIHGKANTKDCLLFGHNKNSMQIILENTNSNECFYDTTIDDFAMWVGYLMKNVDYNLSLVSPILDKLTALENIYILGYSFNEIDSTYIRFISNNNFIYNRHPHWHISYYTEKDKIIIKEFIKTSRLNKNEFTLFKLKEIVKTDLINKNNSNTKMHM